MKSLSNFTFSFKFISHVDVVKELNKLKSKKASQKTNIPIKIVKENVDIMSHFQYHNFNNSLSCSTFSTGMKYADVKPVYSKFQCRFWKCFNAQQCLLTVVEKWRKTLDKGGETGAVLTDLSKAFNCIDHNLLIAKLNA